jgi:hypothetical protein
MVLTTILAVLGVSLIVFAFWRFGFSHRSVFSPPGLLTLAGIALIVAAVIFGVIQSQRNDERAKFDASLVKMFGRPPDRLDLQGNDLLSFKGTAYYGGKRFQLETKCDSFNEKMSHYRVIATPMDGK